MNVAGKRVFVGLSGGVDSAVTAALLREAGAHITGVFIKGWYPPGMPCTWASDRRDAMRVAASLHIPFTTLDASDEYRKGVIDYLLSEYKRGRTPNPDIMCNREVKFGAFYTFAKEKGADAVATGHYARSTDGRLLRGIDPAKDQSYFLWAVPKEAIRNTLFPLGERHKDETRRLAKQYKLPVAEKRDSQGICFLGSISVEDFLRSEFGTESGKVLDEKGLEVGTHDGALLHTIGERLSSVPEGPWYVIGKDVEANTLAVSKDRLSSTPTDGIRLTNTNWFRSPEADRIYDAQYRYHGPLVRGEFKDGAFIPRDSLPEALAPGQSLVLYEGEECIGGGIIE